jgi:DNA-binding response OmpR family regulator
MTPAAGARSVLVIDDEPAVRYLVRVVLEAEGFVVAEAEDASTAREAIQRGGRPLDLIVMDVWLPDVAGAELLPELRRLSPGSRVLAVSGMSEGEAEVGADGFLQKPFLSADLRAAVRRVLGERGA